MERNGGERGETKRGEQQNNKAKKKGNREQKVVTVERHQSEDGICNYENS